MLSVIIGRFQTNKLHQGHLELIRQAKGAGNDILILIGTTAAIGTDKNPLGFVAVKHLFDTHFSTTPILPLEDMPSNKDWSDKIDGIIKDLGYNEAVIFGGRDNSIEDYYVGKHQIIIIDQQGAHSATAIRKEIAKEPINCPNFRAGIIHHVENRYPIVYSTVDIILWRYILNNMQILMGKKGDKYCLIGGFIDPNDENLKQAAYRELFEETGIERSELANIERMLVYKYSIKVNDNRYTGTKDSIMTHVFEGCYDTLPDKTKIQDKEFTEFRFIGNNEIDLIQDCHKPIVINFFNSNR